MKIIYDSQIFCNQQYGGISKYFLEISNSTYFEYNIPYIKQFIKSIEFKERYQINDSLIVNFPKIRSLFDRFQITDNIIQNTINKSLKNFYPDIYHATSKIYEVPHDVKKVVTVHDCTHEANPSFYQSEKLSRIADIMKKEKIKQLQQADKIISISNNTKNDILKFYPFVNPEKIEVIYHGGLTETRTKNVNLPQEYLLFVGNRTRYKNFQVVIEAFSNLSLKNPNLYLICVGGGTFAPAEINLFIEKNIERNIIQLQNVDVMELNYIYRKATLFLFPSIYEGFGMPILEAFENNCPTILSNKSCFPEIAQDAACYFDPYNIDELTDQISKLLKDQKLRSRYINLGKLRGKDFSWNKSKLEHFKLYKSII